MHGSRPGLREKVTFLALAFCLAAGPAAAARPAAELIKRGSRQTRTGDLTAAISTLELATRKDPDSPEAYALLGDAYYRRAFQAGTAESANRDDARTAVDAYRTAQVLDPGLRRVSKPFSMLHGLAQCYEVMGRYEDALAALKKAAALDPRNPMPHLYAARLRLRMNDAISSAANLELSARRARSIKAYPKLVRFVKADERFSDLLRAPETRAVLQTYAQVQKGKLSETQARARLQRDQDARLDSLIVEPGEQLRDSLTDARPSEEGELYRRIERSSQFSAPPAATQPWASAAPAHSHVWERIASSYRQLGLPKDSVRVLKKVSTRLPAGSSMHYELALAHAADGKSKEALSELSLALEKARSSDELRQTLLAARSDPELEGVRKLPRYKQLLRIHARRLTA